MVSVINFCIRLFIGLNMDYFDSHIYKIYSNSSTIKYAIKKAKNKRKDKKKLTKICITF